MDSKEDDKTTPGGAEAASTEAGSASAMGTDVITPEEPAQGGSASFRSSEKSPAVCGSATVASTNAGAQKSVAAFTGAEENDDTAPDPSAPLSAAADSSPRLELILAKVPGVGTVESARVAASRPERVESAVLPKTTGKGVETRVVAPLLRPGDEAVRALFKAANALPAADEGR